MLDQLLDHFQAVMGRFRESIIELLPNVVGALVIIIVGVVAARVLRFITNRFLKNLDRVIPHRKVRSRLEPMKIERTASVISNILYSFACNRSRISFHQWNLLSYSTFQVVVFKYVTEIFKLSI